MTSSLTRRHSPLDQVQRPGRTHMKRSNRPLSLEDESTVRRLMTEKYEYMDHDLFDLPEQEAMRQIFDEAEDVPKPDTSWYHPVMDRSLSDIRRQKNAGTVLLTAAQERVIFSQYNYCRMRVCVLRDRLQEERSIDPDVARDMLEWFRKADAYRQQIAHTNLALVLAMAKRTRMSEVDFADLISEGNMALMRAVDKFDCTRGFKFSTYACRAIIKAFSRQGIKLSKYRQLFPTDFDPKLERSNHAELKRDEHEEDCVSELKDIVTRNRADLSQIEREVIEHRFAVNKPVVEGEDEPKPLTLEQVGKIIGVTKERVRQIQNKALVKLRNTMEDEFLV
ncbi:MAG: sigma-70 family RNA polymerase sigma factor [Planctomycetota bacterium]